MWTEIFGFKLCNYRSKINIIVAKHTFCQADTLVAFLLLFLFIFDSFLTSNCSFKLKMRFKWMNLFKIKHE